jgi:hypothetical protein
MANMVAEKLLLLKVVGQRCAALECPLLQLQQQLELLLLLVLMSAWWQQGVTSHTRCWLTWSHRQVMHSWTCCKMTA